ncbi:RNA polymerase factor sigma-54 [Vogesella oryzae]|uniref:RNA polymerase factor sigma-54 n=1 Tax=Vogesella oryzae TaxID=1735285 RepID=UPI0015828A56|nr:RNA polymerase factor sigma-54 [Vogesella oryzae]
MKQTLQLKVSQQLTLTPQLQQSIKLLQMSTLDLSTELERYLLENPLLERADGDNQVDSEQPAEIVASSETASDSTPAEEAPREHEEMELGDWGSGGGSGSRDDDDEFDPILNTPCRPTLREHLAAQIGEMPLSRRDSALLTLLIDELDEDGYLTTPLDEFAASLPLELDVDTDELEYLRKLLLQFEPVGIGSHHLAEFLQLQLAALAVATPSRELAITLVRDHLALLGNRDFVRLKKLLNVGETELRAAHQLISTLRPRPTSGFDQGETHYVVPDIHVVRRGGRWVAQLNRGVLPKLQVNQLYAGMLQQRDSSHNLSGQLQEARWLVKNIQQRFDTILKVSEAIVDRQQAFFEHGEVAMRSLILRDIADELGLHESTISRVTTQKYLLCSRGLFELKYFFGNALETDSGGECSATAIKAHIRQIIDAEDSKKPLSDSAIADRLTAQGIQVARRTVAKYREAMQIPPVNLRKAL